MKAWLFEFDSKKRFEKLYTSLPMACNWWIENETVYFLDTTCAELFSLNLGRHSLKSLSAIPVRDTIPAYRLASVCVKCHENIYCFPELNWGYTPCIWKYNLKMDTWESIKINDWFGEHPYLFGGLRPFLAGDDCIYILLQKQGKIFRFDTSNQQYNFIDWTADDNEKKESVSVIGLDRNVLFFCCVADGSLYGYDIHTTQTTSYKIPALQDKRFVIYSDGHDVWASGCEKQIYHWQLGESRSYDVYPFPADFAYYDFHGCQKNVTAYGTNCFQESNFMEAICLNGYVWWIPFRTNKILVLNISTGLVSPFEIPEESETKASLLADTRLKQFKYKLAYIRENRHIGLYSVLNQCLLEIDTWNMKYERIEYALEGTLQLYPMYAQMETYKFSLTRFLAISGGTYCEQYFPKGRHGKQIYEFIIGAGEEQ